MNYHTGVDANEVGSAISREFWDTMRRQGHRFPEQDLLLAVLKDALLSYRKNLRRGNQRARRMWSADRAWFFDSESDRLFSFEAVCDALGLCPESIRQQLRGWEQQG